MVLGLVRVAKKLDEVIELWKILNILIIHFLLHILDSRTS